MQVATLSKLRSECMMFGSFEVCKLRIKIMNYCFVIDMKQNTPARPINEGPRQGRPIQQERVPCKQLTERAEETIGH